MLWRLMLMLRHRRWKMSKRVPSLTEFISTKQPSKNLLLPPQGTFDSIVSNPPFFQQSLKAPDAKRTLARHTDSLSFRDLIKSAVRLLAATGEFSVVIPFNMRQSLIDEAIIQGLSLSRSVAVKTVPHKAAKRYLLAFRKERPEIIEEQEVVMTESGERSPWYQELTKDFYL